MKVVHWLKSLIVLQEWIEYGSIQSRPMKNKPFEYFFFVEIEGDMSKANDCIEQIQSVCESVKVLGAYTLKEEK